ncbi:polysaccharide biosynthesis/export family protein [Deferrisoma camini]|uniref:polysaccharide biosynthesis/export family protein n=1 Tax=Deferrisoma camini TaxID=1035120 RepID=UPI00046D91FA|nr:polysaccharide biosynthesis/export family protein [Deferrisoma camini]
MMQRIGVFLAALVLTAGVALGAGNGVAKRPAYRIGVEDVLDIQVWKNPEVSRQVWVRPDGRITLPLVGEIFVEGMTLAELTDEVTTRLKEYFTDPVVTVSLVEINSYTVYLLGRVNSPGAMKLRSPKTFLQVLSMAGGFQEFADTDSVMLLRWEGDKEKRIPVDAESILKRGEGDFLLRPGDVIVVP